LQSSFQFTAQPNRTEASAYRVNPESGLRNPRFGPGLPRMKAVVSTLPVMRKTNVEFYPQ